MSCESIQAEIKKIDGQADALIPQYQRLKSELRGLPIFVSGRESSNRGIC